MKTRLSNFKGFTLIELMIVIAIIAILLSIALPSYQDSVRKSRRATAQSDLLVLVNFMERTYTESNAYNPAGFSLPYTASPKSGTQFYTLSLSASTEASYTLQAAPVVGSPQASDTCGTMTITHTGVKTPAANCW